MANPIKPVTKTGRGSSGTTIFEFVYDGKKYTGQYHTDTANNNFLKVIDLRWEPMWVLSNVTTPGRSDFTRISQSPQYQTALFASIADLKREVNNQGYQSLAANAAQQSGQQNVWNNTPSSANGGTQPTPFPPGWTPPATVPGLAPTAQTQLDQSKVVDNAPALPGFDKPPVLYYPIDAYEKWQYMQDHLMIEMFQYQAPQADLLSRTFADIIEKGLPRGTNRKDYRGMIRLPIPNQLGIGNAVNWGEDSANAFTTGAFAGAFQLASQATGGNFGGALAGLTGGTFNAIKTLMNMAGSNTPSGVLLTALAAQYGLGAVGINADPRQFITRATGSAINPNLELLFNGPKLRNFEFEFDFAPNSAPEAAMVRQIIKFLRRGMSPKRDSNKLIFIGSPDVFRLSYLGRNSNRIKGLNTFKICALTNCEVDFTPDGVYQSYDDKEAVSMPVKLKMRLAFTELTPIFAQDYDLNQTDPSVLDAFGPGHFSTGEPLTIQDIGF